MRTTLCFDGRQKERSNALLRTSLFGEVELQEVRFNQGFEQYGYIASVQQNKQKFEIKMIWETNQPGASC